MASWHKPARIGVAIVGLATIAVVFASMGERRAAAPPPPVPRSDPDAVAEFVGNVMKRLVATEKIADVTAERWGQYEDGSLKGVGVTILVRRGGRTFTVKGSEGRVGKNESTFELSDQVRLEASDGFFMMTDRATFDVDASTAHAPGAVAFGKGRMSGSGTDMTYNLDQDVLRVTKAAQVNTVDEAGKPMMQFSSGTATLDRLQHLLTMDTSVHVVRNAEMVDSDHAVARLSEANDVVTFVELRGNSRVSGGESIDRMNARDIDLDYTDDGVTLEAVRLAGSGSMAMKGENGAPGSGIAGETVDLALAADGTLTRVVGRQNVKLDLPSSAEAPQRSISAQELDGTGQPGKGLTAATFTTDVQFTEQPSSKPAGSDSGPRTARSQRLEVSLADSAVTSAMFTGGDVTFEETGLKACAGRLDYTPGKGTLNLSTATKAGNPMIAEEQVAIEGERIDVALDTRRMRASGAVRTVMRSVARCKPSTARTASQQGNRRTPGLLDKDSPVTIIGTSLDYDSRTGYAEYKGSGARRPRLDQGDTSITGDTLVIDQTKGDLTATGNAVSQLAIDGDRSVGRAHEITYRDQERTITYTAGRGVASEASINSGPNETLHASERIVIRLAQDDNSVKEMAAFGNVRAAQGPHTVTGGAKLTYYGGEEKFVVESAGATPVVVVTREPGNCRENVGRVVTFFKGRSDKVTIDGVDTGRASTAPSKSACAPAR